MLRKWPSHFQQKVNDVLVHTKAKQSRLEPASFPINGPKLIKFPIQRNFVAASFVHFIHEINSSHIFVWNPFWCTSASIYYKSSVLWVHWGPKSSKAGIRQICRKIYNCFSGCQCHCVIRDAVTLESKLSPLRLEKSCIEKAKNFSFKGHRHAL